MIKKKHKKKVMPKAMVGAIIQGAFSMGQAGRAGAKSFQSTDDYGYTYGTKDNAILEGVGGAFNPMGQIKDIYSGDYSREDKRNMLMMNLVNPIGAGIMKNKADEQLRVDASVEREHQANLQYLASNAQATDYNMPTFKYGGQMEVDNIEGNTHQQGGTNIGNMLEAEKGETKVEDYIFSDTLKPSKKDIKDYNLPASYKNKTFAEISKEIEKDLGKRKNDKLDNEEKERQLDILRDMQEEQRQKSLMRDMQRMQEKYPELLQQSRGAGLGLGMGGGQRQEQMQQMQQAPPMQQMQQMQPSEQQGQLPQFQMGGGYDNDPERFDANGNMIHTNKVTPYQGVRNVPYSGRTGGIPPNNVLRRKGTVDAWGNEELYDASAIQKYNESLSDVDLNSAYNWKDKKFLGTVPSSFTKDRYEDFRDYYKGATGSEYAESYEKIIKKVNEASKYGKGNTTDISYGSTDNATIPMLTGFLQYDASKGKKAPTVNSGGFDWRASNVKTEEGTGGTDADDGIFDWSTNNGSPNLSTGGEQGNAGDGIEDAEWSNSGGIIGYGGEDVNVWKDPNTYLGAMGSIFDVARGTWALGRPKKKLDRLRQTRVDPYLLDPTRAIQDANTQYGSAAEGLRQNTSGVGSYLANRLGLAYGQADAVSKINQKYGASNANIVNQTNAQNAQRALRTATINAQQGNREEEINQREEDVAMNTIQHGLSNFSGSNSAPSCPVVTICIEFFLLTMKSPAL